MATLAFATLRGAEPSSLRSCPPCQLLQLAMRGFPSSPSFLRSGPSRDWLRTGPVAMWRAIHPVRDPPGAPVAAHHAAGRTE